MGAAISAAPERAQTLLNPNWHDPAEVAAVLSRIAKSDRKHRLQVAEFLIPRLPRRTLVSDTLKTAKASSHRTTIRKAWRMGWISLNCRTHVNAITVDIDHDRWEPELRALAAQGVPVPSFVVANPNSGHAQATWVLPIGADRQNAPQMRLVDGIRKRLTELLDGDTNFKNWLIRNPITQGTLVSFSGHAVELSDLLTPLIDWAEPGSYVLGPKPRIEAQFEGRAPNIPAVPARVQDVAGDKGSRVWEVGRHAVYRLRTSDLVTITATLSRTASDLKSPITAKALDGMGRRISDWMGKRGWANGRPASDLRNIDHGAMTREAEQRGMRDEWIRTPKAVKLPLAAERTNAIRAGKTTTAISAALEKLAQGQEEISQASLAKASGLSRRTVSKLWTEPLSGICQQCALRSYPFSEPARGSPPPSSLYELVLSINEKIRESNERKKKEEAAIASYTAQAERMMRRGGKPEDVPPRGPGASPEVIQAHKAALAARRDAIRRREARAEQRDQKARREERLTNFQSWAQAGDRAAFDAFYSSEIARWDSRELLIDPAEKEEIRTHNLRKWTHLKRIRAEWQRARQGGLRRQTGVRRAPDFLDSRAREICVERIVDDRSYVISAGKNT